MDFQPGSLVRARGREWVVLPGTGQAELWLRPLGGTEDESTLFFLPLEPEAPEPAQFSPPDPSRPGSRIAGGLLRDSLKLRLRAGAGPFRSFGNIAFEPRAYQLVPLLMALRMATIRLLIADDVGVGKTVEAGLVLRELLDRGEIDRFCVICPPHLCEQWQQELREKFGLATEIVRTGTAGRLERTLPAGQSIFEAHPFTVVSLDYIKADRRRDEFLRACPECVIIEEAHTCVHGGGGVRHQRFQLLRGLADTGRHLIFLTATPHSGNEDAFYNLLGLLDPDFARLRDIPEGTARGDLRERLTQHFVQRRRADIREWREREDIFPARRSAEATYTLDGDWQHLFEDVLAYARTLVARADGRGLAQQRMSWWAALALLRCVGSSPAAARVALTTRLKAIAGEESLQVAEMDRLGSDTVLDGESLDTLSVDETVPAALEPEADPGDTAAIQRMLDRVGALQGPAADPKLALLIAQVKELLAEGFRPVVFCRYIATTHYLGEHLRHALARSNADVIVVTGELTPEERRDRIESLAEDHDACCPVLVASDCLSEGINLQHLFTAVVHYDLSWNPTRHEQREGRVDRFGQAAREVRTLMLYGGNNPVDGAVLQVILRKAEHIRKELGVSIPMPADNNKVVEAIMRTVLLRGDIARPGAQLALDFGETGREVEIAWESAKEKEKQSRTRFAQARLKPEEVLPEWNKALGTLGGPEDVERFLRRAAERLGARADARDSGLRLPLPFLPERLKERLETLGVDCSRALSVTTANPPAAGFASVHRSHPLVTGIADYIAERALADTDPDLAARCGALVTRAVAERTTLLLLRLRHQIAVDQGAGESQQRRDLLAEECLTVRVDPASSVVPLSDADALALMEVEAVRNMTPAEQTFEIEDSLTMLPGLGPALEALARSRAEALLEDHRRVRKAGGAKGLRYHVSPCLPVDQIGLYVLLP